MADDSIPSMLLVNEHFAREQDEFLIAFRQQRNPAELAGFVERWKKDHRPWAREQMFAYLREPFNQPGHEPVVKRLFKHADANEDDELMAVFLHAFDCLIRHRRVTRYRYDLRSRLAYQYVDLVMPRDTIRGTIKYRDPYTGKLSSYTPRVKPNDRLFSYRTRYYIRRRAWRYFRRLGFQRPKEYLPAITAALKLYRNDDLLRGEDLLDCWGLMHALFQYSKRIEFTSSQTRLSENAELKDLEPAPAFPELWREEQGFNALFDLLRMAPSRLARLWSVKMLRREHAERFDRMPLRDVVRMLADDEPEIQLLARDMFLKHPQLATLTVDEWLALLDAGGDAALETVCDAMQKHVIVDRLTLDHCLRFTTARQTPVAQMGFEFLKQKSIESADDVASLIQLAQVKCSVIAASLTEWAFAYIGVGEHYKMDDTIRFFDSPQPGCRESAWNWLQGETSPGRNDSALWSRLLETPYEDLRLRIVDELERRSALPDEKNLNTIWISTLLGVHRGGRRKLKALRQVCAALERDPQQAAMLAPALALAVRSVRETELRAGLAAVGQTLDRRPELEQEIKQCLPELELPTPEAVR